MGGHMTLLSNGARLGVVLAASVVLHGCGELADGASYATRADGSPSNTSAVGSGRLTAGAWDDNRNFGFFAKYLSDHMSLAGRPPFSTEEHEAANERVSARSGPRQRLDIALVIDTTGSMGDEIGYLQEELGAISRAIEERYAEAEQRWALVVYRDRGDSYVVRGFDFMDDPSEMRRVLDAQGPDGGGDYPEAPEAALAAMNELSWRDEADVARLAFWFADAPHHEERRAALADAVRGAAARDVHIYPVASSGVDELTELSMRAAAQLTGGRYLFLTDDSGIGDAHKEPTIPCYFVTKLDRAMLRMVDIEMTGVHREPAADEVIRTGGGPTAGVCRLESGDAVSVF